ncbi:asparagine synthase (glutamine-hydrolyzing) [Desulfobacca acetoxidans]|uniref:asparagine synthase (glutamine-hydrolyzing) n=1 Tax=Desulfobacca acetoxidans (strain ATCC 700848 / DSM 11109 / ASRB2) TaxID=880072 RepID=F2NJJ9_DESAR|nr:asparagine synthase (glutamine-hydrolyzing) [Desulfobacca acetoxidans]AEB09511.1 asparagine synthase (glutamine-hydrolyzing) [Desulfobacca acetoxidans DSM 11109]
MCGIAGIYYLCNDAPSQEGTRFALERMNQAQAHRGPDDEGIWQSPNSRVGFGHRRLSIIDLSSAGHQPMSNEDGSIWITYNGEIYNYQLLREELLGLGHIFRSQSDTEVIIHAYEEWGIDAFRRFRGMFAFGLWDGHCHKLYLVKDRFGIKPLYYYQDQDKIAFASEVRALSKSGLFQPHKNHDALIVFLLFGSVPIPMTTVKGVLGIPAGHFLLVENGHISMHCYYDLWTDGIGEEKTISADEMRHLLQETVAQHLISDAPIGLFLSGGIDSSALVALGATAKKSRLTTLSIIFDEAEYSEQKYQQLIAGRYHTDHRELTVTSELFQEEMPKVFQAMDQPSIDGVNTYFVSLMAKKAGLKAVLAGTGGDEVFCGYPHFKRACLLSKISKLGFCLRSLNGLTCCLPGKWQKLAFLGLDRSLGLYLMLRGLFSPAEVAQLTDATIKEVQRLATSMQPLNGDGHSHQMGTYHPVDMLSRWEIHGYLQNQLLKDTDCMSMAHSLETRVPFLDPLLISTVLAIRPKERINPKVPKVLLTQALSQFLPQTLVYRPKMTFTFPIGEWLKQKASFWQATSQTNTPAARQVWQDFAAGIVSWTRPWALIIAEMSNLS